MYGCKSVRCWVEYPHGKADLHYSGNERLGTNEMITLVLGAISLVVILCAIVSWVTWVIAYDRGWNDRSDVRVSMKTVERLKKWEVT